MSNVQYPMFFYGTLMSGESAGALLGENVTRREPATLPAAALLNLGAYPMVVAGAGLVRGELCRLPAAAYEELLVRLDRYEGPQYARVLRPVIADGAEETVDAWVYMGTQAPPYATPVPTGDWRQRDRTANA